MKLVTKAKGTPKRFELVEKASKSTRARGAVAVAELPVPTEKPQVVYWDTKLVGLGVVVGRTGTRTFVAEGRVNGRKTRKAIGVHGRPREDGNTWTLKLARDRGKEILGQLAGGIDPNREKQARRNGPTLRDGLELHVENMRKKRRSERSIHAIETEISKYLGAWLDRPIVDLNGADLEAVCKRVMAQVRPRAGSVNPPGAALTNRLVAQVSAIWNALDRLHDLPGKNPAKRITTHALAAKENRIPDADLPGWYDKVLTLSPVRRDMQLLALFTGLRSESVRTLRWEDFDADRRVLHVRKAKYDRPYTVPLAKTHIEILERRRAENAVEFDPHGGDHGLIFPSLTRSRPFRVQPVAEAKEYRREKATGRRVQFLPGLHPLRKTFNSIAMEIGIAKEHRESLMNHEGQGVNVKHYGFPQNWDHLAKCQGRIEAAILERLGVRDRGVLARLRPV